MLLAVIKDDPEAAEMFREAMKSQRGGDHTTEEGKAKDNNVMDCSQATQGNSRAYSIGRVRRDAPQFLDAVMKKEMSPHAAAAVSQDRSRIII